MSVCPNMRMSSFLSVIAIIGMIIPALNTCSQEQSLGAIKIGVTVPPTMRKDESVHV